MTITSFKNIFLFPKKSPFSTWEVNWISIMHENYINDAQRGRHVILFAFITHISYTKCDITRKSIIYNHNE
jgi:hypothetical protein